MTASMRMLTVKEAAELTGYSAWTIRKFCREGTLKSHKRSTGLRTTKNTKIMIPEDALGEFLGVDNEGTGN